MLNSGVLIGLRAPIPGLFTGMAWSTPVVGRKNFYGSGSQWSGKLAATMYSVLQTLKLWGINSRTWLTAYLQACGDNGGEPPGDISTFLPWQMDAKRLSQMRVPTFAQGIDSS